MTPDGISISSGTYLLNKPLTLLFRRNRVQKLEEEMATPEDTRLKVENFEQMGRGVVATQEK
jgi:hypothetical protein